jgi:hypothetical protein
MPHITLRHKKTMALRMPRGHISGHIRHRFFSKIKRHQGVADVMVPNVGNRTRIIRCGITDHDVSVTVPLGVLSVA